MRKKSDITELKVVASLCLGGPQRVYLSALTREELEYAKHLLNNNYVVLRGGFIEPSKRLCELYERYLQCYNDISKKCEWPYGHIHECWMREWAKCLALLP